MKNKGYAEFGGGGGGGQIRCIMGDVQVENRSLCGGESSPPTTPLSKIRYQNRSLPRVQPNKVVPTLILSFDKLSLGLSQKVFFLLQSEGKGFVIFFFYKQFLQISSLCWNDANGDTTCLLLLMRSLLSHYDFPLRLPCSKRTKLNTRKKIGPRLPSIRAHKTLHRKMIKSLLKPLPLINNRHCASSVAGARGETVSIRTLNGGLLCAGG